MIARDGFFYLPLTPIIDSYFFCTPFISESRLFNNAVTLIADVRLIVMTVLRRYTIELAMSTRLCLLW